MLGLTSFGGPVAHLSYFRLTLVEKKQWVSEEQYAQLMAFVSFYQDRQQPARLQTGFG
ncbi:chromate transporter [Sinobacterium norvegicum]|uniref:chromate transporter n=1 Tax=Sinobacterium norvegicum TaxID=1641715 RepID=UPI001F00790C|nr:chromate transporter [Sinobacterium norvegicum]